MFRFALAIGVVIGTIGGGTPTGLVAAEQDPVTADGASEPAGVASRGVESDAVSFQDDVRPLLARRCFACHGPDERAGGLDLSSFEGATGETDSGERALVPGDAAGSELLRRITSHEEWERMPEGEEALEPEEIETLRAWIAAGGTYKRHWGFEPVREVTPPAVDDEAWVRSPLDRFVLARLEAAELSPAPEADRGTLARRLYQDLIGLPPTPEQVQAFLEDDQPRAYERLVDELLSSPHYGERWARHWLDVVRWAETNSFERDGDKPNAWTYRDFVINAFNDDLPYPEFLRQQLAGDELPQPSESMLAATGFLRLGLWDDEPADPELHLFDQYDDLVRTVGEGMLGLTVGCARCHDHKIDPIPQTDYYGLVAFFRGMPGYAERHDITAYNQIEVTDPDARTQHEQLDRRHRELGEAMRVIEQRGIEQMPGPDQRASEGPQRGRILRKLKDYLTADDWTEYERLRAERIEAETTQAELPPRRFVMGIRGVDATPPATHILERGSPQAPAAAVEPRFPELFETAAPAIPTVGDGAKSSGRRRVLADWIAANPSGVPARVMVNRLWQHHFGRGIVSSANNFGQLGTPPTHPDLLDWLAGQYPQRRWSTKAMHRLIVTSATYRMSGQFDETAATIDPQNTLLWRFPIRRMDAEEIRDAILAVSGDLTTDRIGGPSVYPEMPAEVLAGLSRPNQGWGRSSEADRNRRSLYVFSKRSLPLPLFAAFDFPETDATCEGRFQTVQAAQALSLLNSRFLQRQSERLAARLQREAGPELADQLRHVVWLLFAREASEAELVRWHDLFERLQREHGLGEDQARQLVCLTLLNTSEFVFVP